MTKIAPKKLLTEDTGPRDTKLHKNHNREKNNLHVFFFKKCTGSIFTKCQGWPATP